MTYCSIFCPVSYAHGIVCIFQLFKRFVSFTFWITIIALYLILYNFEVFLPCRCLRCLWCITVGNVIIIIKCRIFHISPFSTSFGQSRFFSSYYQQSLYPNHIAALYFYLAAAFLMFYPPAFFLLPSFPLLSFLL